MKIKTNEEIKNLAAESWDSWKSEDDFEFDGDYYRDGYGNAYSKAQSDLLESASESVDSFYDQYLYVNELGELYTKVIVGSKLRSSPITFETFEKCWQAAKLSDAKLIKEKDERIKELENKYQEAVEDIEFLSEYPMDEYDSYFDKEYKKVKTIKAKYGLDKQESKR